MIEAFEVRVGAAPDEALEEAVERVMRERDAAVQAHVGVTLAEVRRVLHMGEGEESIEGAERVMAELDRAERDAAVAREALAERLRLDAEAEAGQRAVRGEPEEGTDCGEQAVRVLTARCEAP